MTGIENLYFFVKVFFKKKSNLIIKVTGKSKIEKIDIFFISQNFGLEIFIVNNLYVFLIPRLCCSLYPDHNYRFFFQHHNF